jgi:predicted Zn-dependent protease
MSSHNVVRDQHGNPIPGFGDDDALAPAQVDEALGGLPGWERHGTSLTRDFAVEQASYEALREGVRNAAGSVADIAIEDGDGRMHIVLSPGTHDLTVHHIEAAARIDRVLSGSASDHGTL